jgi:hypothetical protein
MSDDRMTLWLGPKQLSPEEGWLLVRWALEVGADEFSFSCLAPSRQARFCTETEGALSTFHIGHEKRPALSQRLGEGRDREVPLWRLNDKSLIVLQKLLPEGIFTDRQGSRDGWIEDLTMYQAGHLRLGVITHEHEAALNLTEDERQQLRDRNLLR